MSVDLTHPLVADYLHRLETAAAVLAATRRGDLVAEIREHLTDALAGTAQGPDGEVAVRAVLDRLGTPEEIVAAELSAAGAPSGEAAVRPAPDLAAGPIPPPGHLPVHQGGPAPGSGSVWSPVEVVAVLGLTLGTFVLPVVGPVVGLVCAWASNRWTRREKVVATIWSVLAPVALTLLAAVVVFGLRVTPSVEQVDQAPAPVISGQPIPSAPASEVTP